MVLVDVAAQVRDIPHGVGAERALTALIAAVVLQVPHEAPLLPAREVTHRAAAQSILNYD